jgi:anti-sigma regulatory factor (Ser/Thr protein kinase)
MREAGGTKSDFRHLALFYRTAAEYETAASRFLVAGSAAGEPALVAVPDGKHTWLAELAGADGAAGIEVADMTELGRNPARIIPAIRSFIDKSGGARIRYLGESIWPGRSPAEIREAVRNEALINVAFAGVPVTMLCPYDASALPPPVIADSCRTHPLLAEDEGEDPSPVFSGPGTVPADCDAPLSPVPASAIRLEYRQNLRDVRDLVTDQAKLAGLPEPRAVDFVLAASEVAANTLRHTQGGGTISLWITPAELLCQLDDTGHIKDVLAGRRPPDHDHPGGQGLWLVNKVCDLVELRTGPGRTTVRLHIQRRGSG